MNPWHNARLLDRISTALTAAAVLALVAAAASWAVSRPRFALEKVRVMSAGPQALRYVPERTLEHVLRRAVHGTFFSAELESIREQVETVPWVRHASVRRLWPDRLEIRIEEHKALALWQDGRLVNTHRELFSANLDEAEEDGPLPQLGGPPGSEAEVVARYLSARRLIEPLGLVPVSVTESARRAWRMQLDDGTVLVLGRDYEKTPIDTRIAQWVDAYPTTKARLNHRAGVIDMRYQNGFAIRALAQIAGPDDGDGQGPPRRPRASKGN